MPEFAQPAWLALLALLPVVVALRHRLGPRENRLRQVTGSVFRCIALATLVVALAGPLERGGSPHADVMFVLDVSDSVQRETRERALAFVNRALLGAEAGMRMGLVVFGGGAAVEVLPRESSEPVAEISTHVERGATDIAAAIEVAAGALPPGGARRIVLLSDGRENLGRARAAAATARSIGIEIWPIALANSGGREEIYVENLAALPRVRENEPFEVQVTLHSETRTTAELSLMRNGALLHSMSVELQPGANALTVVDEAPRAGLYEYEAVVNSARDVVQENNRYQTFVEVLGAPKVLLAHGDATAEPYVAEALRAQGLTVQQMSSHALPATLHALVEYDLVVLDNVSGFDLSLEKMQLLEDYVRTAGGGLITLGGDNSYAAGGYYDTPVERALPVTMDVRTAVKIPTLAVTIVLDKSASMGERVTGGEKLDIAKVAALSAVEVLSPLDRVGILAFDTKTEWTVLPTEVGNRRAITERLRTLRAGGSTDVHVALREAYRVMREQEAKVKHLIVLSDGLTDKRHDFDALTVAIAEAGITVSTVTFGADADRELMQRIATLGRGRFYHTEDMRDVPRIFTSETLVVARDLVVERQTQPVPGYPGEILKGFAAQPLPSLAGYQRTYAKPAAQVLLHGPEDDPLLVSWRYGLGKSVAFMSDLGGRWGREWVQWPQFGRFVAQMARWTMRRGGVDTLLPGFTVQGQRGELSVDVLDRDERFVNGVQLEAVITAPDRSSHRVALLQVAPGRYRGEFPVSGDGRYYASVSGIDGERRLGPRTFGLAVPYSSEYVERGIDQDLLEDLASATGGELLPLEIGSLAVITRPASRADSRRWRVWWPFLLGALIALLLEVAVRRVGLPESWTARWRRTRDGPEPDPQPEPAYEELQAAMIQLREQRVAAARAQFFYDPDDPAARARLYLGGARSPRR